MKKNLILVLLLFILSCTSEIQQTIVECPGILFSEEDRIYVTSDENTYEGNYSIRSNSGYYGYEYLEKTVTVPQYTYIYISFWSKGVNDGDGNYVIVDENDDIVFEYGYWGYNYNGSNWYNSSTSYYTGSNTEITLRWQYYTENYGYGYLDNIQVTW